MRFGIKRLISFVAILMTAAAAHGQSSPHKAPALSIRDLKGRTIRLSDYKGKVVLLNFWATWCPPCRAEIPDLVSVPQEYGKLGLQIIGITYPPQTIKEVRKFSKELKINYTIALGTKETKILFDQSETLPLTIVIDREGNIRDRIEGILLPEEFEQKINPLLRQAGPERSASKPFYRTRRTDYNHFRRELNEEKTCVLDPYHGLRPGARSHRRLGRHTDRND